MKILRKSLLLLVICSLFVCVLSPLGSLKTYANEEDWNYNADTKTLTIYKDVLCSATENSAPWDAQGYDIEHVVIEHSVDRIEYAFCGDLLSSITIKNKDMNMKKAFCGATCDKIIFTEDISSNFQFGWTDDLSNVTVSDEKAFASYLPKSENFDDNLYPYVVTNIGTDFMDGEWDLAFNYNSYYICFPNQTKELAHTLYYTFYTANDNMDEYSPEILYDLKLNNNIPSELESGTKIEFSEYQFDLYSILGAKNYWDENEKTWVNEYDVSNERNDDFILNYYPTLEKYDNNEWIRYIEKSGILYEKQDHYFTNIKGEKCFIGKIVLDEYDEEVIWYSYNGVDWYETDYADFYSLQYNADYEEYANDIGEYYPIYSIEGYAVNEETGNYEGPIDYYYIDMDSIYYVHFNEELNNFDEKQMLKSDIYKYGDLSSCHYDASTNRYYDASRYYKTSVPNDKALEYTYNVNGNYYAGFYFLESDGKWYYQNSNNQIYPAYEMKYNLNTEHLSYNMIDSVKINGQTFDSVYYTISQGDNYITFYYNDLKETINIKGIGESNVPEAKEPFVYEENSGTLTINEDIIVSKNAMGEYVSPFAAYKDNLSTVILEESVDEIAYAFYGLEIDHLIIKNKDIIIQKGLAGATINSIEFTEDVSDKLEKKWVTDNDNTVYNAHNFSTNTLTYYYPQYGRTIHPICMTNLGTNSDLLDDVNDLPKADSSNWYLWGGLNNVFLFPNQTKETAMQLAYTFYLSNNNRHGRETAVALKKNIPVVYGMTASLPKLEYETGTKLNPDDFIITVLGVGDSTEANEGSYWNYNLQDWVWKEDNSISPNTYNLETILANKYIKYDNKYYPYENSFILKDSYFEYSFLLEGHLQTEKCFIGKWVDNKIWYSYDGINWYETNFTHKNPAAQNNQTQQYANDKGEYYPIYLLNDNMYKVNNDYFLEYYFVENNTLYKAFSGLQEAVADISKETYAEINNVRYNKEYYFLKSYECYQYIDNMNNSLNCFIGKWVDNKIWYSYDGINWKPTIFRTKEDALHNTIYANDSFNKLPIYLIDDSYKNVGDNYYSTYFAEENGMWSKKSFIGESFPVNIGNILSYANIGIMEYDEVTDRYYDYYSAIRIMPDTNAVKLENGYVYTYDIVTKTWDKTAFTSMDDYMNSIYYTPVDVTGYYELNDSFFKKYYTLEDNVWYCIDMIDNTKTVVDMVYTNENHLPLDYDYLTNVENNAASGISACALEPQIMTVSNEAITVQEGDNLITLDYHGLKATIQVKGIGSSTVPATYTIKVIDKYYDENNNLIKETIRNESVLAEGSSYHYSPLSVDGYNSLNTVDYSGTVVKNLELIFSYQKEKKVTPPIKPDAEPNPIPPATVNPTPAPEIPTDDVPVIPEEEIKEDSPVVPKTYKITFMVDGVKYKEVYVAEGEDCVLPANPMKDKYTFDGWDKDLTNVHTNIVTEAVFLKITEPEKTEDAITLPNDIGHPQSMSPTFNAGWFLLLLLILLLVLFILWLILFMKRNSIPFTYILNKKEKEMIITGYKGTDIEVIIEETYKPFGKEYVVTEIADRAFYGLDEDGQPNFNAKIIKVVVPRTVKKIGKEAFKHCNALETHRVLNPKCVVEADAFEK